MAKLILGAHMSISKWFLKAYQMAVEHYKTNALQIFMKSPLNSRLKEISSSEQADCLEYKKNNNLDFVVAHSSYLLNFAHPYGTKQWANDSLIDDLEKVNSIGGVGSVLHLGKFLKMSKEEAINNMIANLNYVLNKTKHLENTLIILENTAGQGTEIGYKFEELALIYNWLNKHPRLKFCLDTCHWFAGGYDFRNKSAIEKTFSEFDKYLGIKNIALIHLNDSLKDLGSRVDRHSDLGEGFIGLPWLLLVAKFAYQYEIPIILETPQKTNSWETQLAMIKKHILS